MAETKRTVPLARLSMGSVMKLLFIANVTVWGLFGLGVGIAALVGADTVTWNEEPVRGLTGFLGALGIAAILCFLATAVTGLLAYLGIWLYGRIRPDAVLVYFEDSGWR